MWRLVSKPSLLWKPFPFPSSCKLIFFVGLLTSIIALWVLLYNLIWKISFTKMCNLQKHIDPSNFLTLFCCIPWLIIFQSPFNFWIFGIPIVLIIRLWNNCKWQFLVSAGLYETEEESALREEVLAQIDQVRVLFSREFFIIVL